MCCKTHMGSSGIIVVKATGNYGGCLWNGKPSGGIEWRAPSVEHSGRRPAAGIPGRNRFFKIGTTVFWVRAGRSAISIICETQLLGKGEGPR